MPAKAGIQLPRISAARDSGFPLSRE